MDRAIMQIAAGQQLTDEQQAWLDRIRSHLMENLSIDREDFDDLPVFARDGGWGRGSHAFQGALILLIQELNSRVAA